MTSTFCPNIELVVISKLATIDTLTKFLFFFISIPHFLTHIQFCYLHQIHYIFKMICSSITSPSICYLFYTQNSINISMFAVSTLYYTFSSSNTQSLITIEKLIVFFFMKSYLKIFLFAYMYILHTPIYFYSSPHK